MRHHWGVVRLRHGSRPFLAGLTGDFWAEHVEFLLGAEVYGYCVRDSNDNILVSLSWSDFLNFEMEVRKRAIRRVNEDGAEFAEALREARTNGELRTKFLVQRLAVSHLTQGVALMPPMQYPQPPKRPALQLEDVARGSTEPYLALPAHPPAAKKAKKGRGKNKNKEDKTGGGKGKGGGKDDPDWTRIKAAKRLSKRDDKQVDGRGECWDYNRRVGCRKPDCQFHHVCAFCGRSHSLVDCNAFAEAQKGK